MFVGLFVWRYVEGLWESYPCTDLDKTLLAHPHLSKEGIGDHGPLPPLGRWETFLKIQGAKTVIW